jgi:GT2 family glycosyltransferase
VHRQSIAAPWLAVVVVNWNGGEYVRRCVDAIFANPPAVPFVVVVVDNASTDGSAAALERRAARDLSIVRLARNVGFAQANNVAFRLTRSPFVLLLNPDTEVAPGSIDVLLDTLRDHPQAGAVGPRLVNADGSTQASVWPNPPGALHLILDGTGLHRLLPGRMRGDLLLGRHWAHDTFRRVPMLSAAAMLVRREVIEVTGGFDESFHMYGEDNDWCARMIHTGYELIFQPSAAVVHFNGRCAEQRWTPLERRRTQLDAHFRFQRRHVSRLRSGIADAAGCAALASALVRGRLGGRDTSLAQAALAAYARDFKQTLFGTRT